MKNSHELPFCISGEALKLTADEHEIFTLLLAFVQKESLGVTLRVAGGWVRDKLLGYECNDLDIAIDKMTGEPFAAKLHRFLQAEHVSISSYGVIQSNPDRSKHLETATLRILGRSIDFVNLRAEEYAQHSRIPKLIKFGTPEEDAKRRDCTINTLFYNINSGVIEDWTNYGLVDLRNGIIRTPLSPQITLLDDPLRLLRIIRFATRFSYIIVPELQAALTDPIVHKAFLAKVSRERVGIELDKIVSHHRGFEGLALMARLNVFPLIYFMEATKMDYIGPTSRDYVILIEIARKRIARLVPARLALLTLGFLPLTVGFGLIQSDGNEKHDFFGNVAKNSLKLANKDIVEIRNVLRPIQAIIGLAKEPAISWDAISLGRLIRQTGENWKLAIALAECYDEYMERESMVGGEGRCSYNKNYDQEENSEEHSRFILFQERITELGLGNCWEWKPVLSGKDIQDILDIREGQKIGVILNKLLEKQYQQPMLTREEATTFIKSIV